MENTPTRSSKATSTTTTTGFVSDSQYAGTSINLHVEELEMFHLPR